MKRWWPLLAALVYAVASVAAILALPKAPGLATSRPVTSPDIR